MRKPILWISLMLWVSFARPVLACESIIPLAQLFSGAITTTGSLAMLLGAITLKALAFIVFEKRLRWYHAFWGMVLANIVSTCIGLALSMTAAFPGAILVVIPVVYMLSVIPANRLVHHHPGGYFTGWNAAIITTIMVGLFLSTWVLFGLAQRIIAANKPLVWYWMLKFLYVYTALSVSIGLTTIWEEWIVAKCAPRTLENMSCHASVLKANLVTSFVVFGYAAILMLPERLQSSDFLVHLFVH